MRERLKVIIRKELIQALREPRMRVMLILPPIIQLIVFGYAANLDVDMSLIAWMDRDDYSRAGFRMISSDDKTGERSASQSVFFCILLLIIAGLPASLGIVTMFYVPFELALGGLFIAVAMRFLRLRTAASARLLFITSIIYLPLLLGALVLTKS